LKYAQNVVGSPSQTQIGASRKTGPGDWQWRKAQSGFPDLAEMTPNKIIDD